MRDDANTKHLPIASNRVAHPPIPPFRDCGSRAAWMAGSPGAGCPNGRAPHGLKNTRHVVFEVAHRSTAGKTAGSAVAPVRCNRRKRRSQEAGFYTSSPVSNLAVFTEAAEVW